MDLHIKDVLKNMVTETKISQGFYSSKIEKYWMSQMPNSISSRTSKVHMKNGILHLTITSAALKNELFNSKSKIISMINDYLGEEIIDQVLFH